MLITELRTVFWAYVPYMAARNFGPIFEMYTFFIMAVLAMCNLYIHFCWSYYVEICPFKEITRTEYSLNDFGIFPFLVTNTRQQFFGAICLPVPSKIQIFMCKYDKYEM